MFRSGRFGATLGALAIVCAVSSSVMAQAGEAVPAAIQEKVMAKLKEGRGDLPYGKLEKSPLEGIYQVSIDGGPTLYVDKTGSHFIAGDLFRIESGEFVNLSEESRAAQMQAFNGTRKEMMAKVKPEDMIIFPAKGKTKATISVFTDVDCGYCRKLHKEVPALNKMGVTVQYLAYPRAGIGSNSYKKIASAWCAKDPRAALGQLKAGKQITTNVCGDNPVAAQYALGQQVGVTGTPALVLEDGSLVPGYMPAEQLAKKLGIH
ncbi:thiol:disulfide interchange protein DsbC [Sinobacterium caligoides]|uniref:Thiol:disulfide interchange protein n=1 Tax=Sinobacterium caligoides TaxID=933926 RepID=A0A3N2DZE7_9GAMM|nr:DsbC family protein [Sinobacterium caligoides]ROS05208.1 thiol:disulfide interchange protein DsbC [Sinobacterium caligoides]